ncbi:aromatic ring-hydroxylating dioxygenase subunit alpha [Iodidimonas sp. SYSU 1G8]|uniref:aromatic ring-hydroxylating oxygenase subunit alpha n=1 Tax=Iodidimonas sp. SYSU 1G8 TaxID=3133967 RepID=UPI0031FE5BB8
MNIEDPKTLKPGEARSEAISVQELLDRERVAVPPVLRKNFNVHMGSDRLPTTRWTSPEFARQEMDKMWSKVWQFACREEHIPDVGDYITYEIGEYSFLVVRTAEETIKAYYNACLHRGNQLKPEGTQGNASELRCTFHGFTWTIDGELADIPCRWDFPHVEDAEYKLPQVKVGTWGGFVFINMDDDAESLESYLGDLIPEFDRWDFKNKYIMNHIAKRVDMNWKVGIEAFAESYHVVATHPQIMPSTADANTQYDVDPDRNYNRMITAMGVPSPHITGVTEQAIVEAMTPRSYRMGVNMDDFKVPEGVTAREFVAEMRRKSVGAMYNHDYSSATDSEMLDAIQYWVFPNFFPWGGFGTNIVYRFRPDGLNPNSALMEVFILSDYDLTKPRPDPAPMRLLGEDQEWIVAEDEIGGLAGVFQQDMVNMPQVQKGMKSLKRGVTLANYQESRLRHLHWKIDEYINAE